MRRDPMSTTQPRAMSGTPATVGRRVTRSGRILSPADLRGTRIRNLAGEELGYIEAVMLDVDDGFIAYAVVSFRAILGTRDTLFPVPWRALSVIQHTEHVVLDAARTALEAAPRFHMDAWPDFSDRAWGREVYDHYGAIPFWNTTSWMEALRSD